MFRKVLHLCVVYGVALPNSSGAPVLDDTRTLRGVHIGSSYHLDTTYQPTEVSLNFHALVSSMLTIMFVAKISLNLELAHRVSLSFGTTVLLRIAGNISGTSHD